MQPSHELQELAASLKGLHASVARLIQVIHDNSPHFENTPQILDKLPILDLYNDDLKRNIELLQSHSPD